ncbi:hypothetical protein [Sessilibacter sp. MAH4]
MRGVAPYSDIIGELILRITWSALRRLSNNKYIKNMYFWAVFVPIAAKALSLVESPLELLLFADVIKIKLSLPFSWSAFFFSSVFFSVALLLFNFFCPKIILENSTFTNYINDGKSLAQLNIYAREVGAEEVNITMVKFTDGDSPEKLDECTKDKFWEIYESAEDYRKTWKYVVSILYILGILIMALVFSQNIFYVFKEVFKI